MVVSKTQTRKRIIEEVFRNSIYHEGKSEIFAFCPNLCNTKKRKLQINIQKNIYHCWVCGDKQSGNIFKLLKKYATVKQKKEYQSTVNFGKAKEDTIVEIHNIEYPESFCLVAPKEINSPKVPNEVYEYIEDELQLDRDGILFKIGFCYDGLYRDRMVFPSGDSNCKLNYFTARSVSNEHYKKWLDCTSHKSKIIFNEYLINWNRPIILTEGIKSHYKFYSSVGNVVPLLGSELRENYRLFQEIVFNCPPYVLLALDGDAERKSNKILNLLSKYDIPSGRLDLCGKNQSDELSIECFKNSILNAKFYDSFDLLKGKLDSI